MASWYTVADKKSANQSSGIKTVFEAMNINESRIEVFGEINIGRVSILTANE